jgi:hypothetical protein
MVVVAVRPGAPLGLAGSELRPLRLSIGRLSELRTGVSVRVGRALSLLASGRHGAWNGRVAP